MKPIVEREICIGCGICPALAPEVFHMSASGDKAEVIESTEYSLFREKIQEAIASCPVRAIREDARRKEE